MKYGGKIVISEIKWRGMWVSVERAVDNSTGFIIHKSVSRATHLAAAATQLAEYRHKSYRLEAESICFVMLGMLKEDKWTAELAICLITISAIVRNSAGHNYQSEDTTGNSEHMLKSFTHNASSIYVRTVQ
jgi:hypothetical protein